ncbi:MAG: long-chain fatty acid--CoA ligase [Chloroflexi bacterium]|nr:long-chain fatty acid--CoA ligase [Chloroflexota bacterium]
MTILPDRPWFRFWPEGVPRHIDYPELPLFELLSNTARKYPDNIAFGCQGRALSFGELDDQSSRLATGLRQLGIKKGDRVMLFLPNCLEFVIGYYGILKAGATVTTASWLYRGKELKHQLNDCQVAAIIAGLDSYPLVRELRSETGLKVVILADAAGTDGAVSLGEILAGCPASQPEPGLKPGEDLAAITYTGGTTGLPKGAMLTHYNLAVNAIQNASWFKWSSRDIVIGLLSFSHAWAGCACINSPVYSGARVIILPGFDAEGLLGTIEKERATVLYGAASMYIMLVNSPAITRYDLSSLRYVKTGAMPIAPEIKQRWEQLTGVKMVLGYGLTEAGPETHNSPPRRVKPGSIGIPIMDTDARIVDEDAGETELPPGKVGELAIRGPQVMKGYLGRPEETSQTLRNGWLYTGDLAVMDEEGYFRIVGRKKETIKYKGYTIAPAEIEAVLYEHPAVRECAVVGRPDALAGEVPKAYVVLKEGCVLTGGELVKFCEQRVAPYKKIREVEFISEIPKTPVGKVLRRVLRDRTCAANPDELKSS